MRKDERIESGATGAYDQEDEPRPCGHETHRGSCPVCQRLQLERWRSQLASVEATAGR